MGSERREGRVSVHPRGFGFVEVAGEPPINAFIAPPELNALVDGDRVAATIDVQPDGRATARELALIERWRTELFGSVVRRAGKPFLRVDRKVSNTDWPLLGESHELADGTTVIASIADRTAVLDRVVDEKDAGLERVLVRHAIRTAVPAAALEEAQHARLEGGLRRDLRALCTITIDAAVSRDLDDALAVLPADADGALRVFVSIADVAALVPEGSALDREARARGTSVYLAGRVVPMLPSELSEDALSLLPGADRPALTVELRIDASGAVTSTDVYETLIRSHARLDYDAVAAFFDEGRGDDVPEQARSTLLWLRTAAARLGAVRRGRGGVELLREEAIVRMDATTREPIAIVAHRSTSAHRLVERLMVAANEAVARWLVDRGLPGVFRVHDEPEPEQVRALGEFARNSGFEAGFGQRLGPRELAAFESQFRDTRVAPAMYTVLGRVLGPARYTVHPSSHFGLAAPLYAHFTSPIRRYADLAVHRIVKAFLSGNRELRPRDERLEDLAVALNDAAYRAKKAEMERLHMVAARLFAGRIGEVHEGNVVAVKPFGLVVELSRIGVSGTVGTDALPGSFRLDPKLQRLEGTERSFAVGQPLRVCVTGVDEDLGRIELGLVPHELPHEGA